MYCINKAAERGFFCSFSFDENMKWIEVDWRKIPTNNWRVHRRENNDDKHRYFVVARARVRVSINHHYWPKGKLGESWSKSIASTRYERLEGGVLHSFFQKCQLVHRVQANVVLWSKQLNTSISSFLSSSRNMRTSFLLLLLRCFFRE